MSVVRTVGQLREVLAEVDDAARLEVEIADIDGDRLETSDVLTIDHHGFVVTVLVDVDPPTDITFNHDMEGGGHHGR